MKKSISALSGMLVFILAVFVTTSAFAQGEPQPVEGFSRRIYVSHSRSYKTYRGSSTTSYYERAGTDEYIEWYTAAVSPAYTTGRVTFLWSGMTGPDQGSHHLYLNSSQILTFTNGYFQDMTWTSGGYELFFDYKTTIAYGFGKRNRDYGAGVFYLSVPAADVISELFPTQLLGPYL